MIDEILSEERKILNEKWVTNIVAAFGSPEKTLFVSPSGNNINDRLWDLASVTKLYSLFAILSLCEEGNLDLRKRVDYYSSSFPGISHLCLYELLNFSSEITTSSRIDMCTTHKEAVEALHMTQLVKRNHPRYSDIGTMIIVQMLNELNASDCFFQNYISDMLKHIGAKRSLWWYEIPDGENNLESYDPEYKCVDGKNLIEIKTPFRTCHDPKARILPLGHAGLFSCASDIALFASHILDESIISKKTLSILLDSTYDCWDSHHHFGLLCNKKHPDTLYSEVPASCSQNSISMSGYTGCHLLLDFDNHCFEVILANRILNRITNLNHDNSTFPYPCTKDWVFRKDDLVRIVTQNLLP